METRLNGQLGMHKIKSKGAEGKVFALPTAIASAIDQSDMRKDSKWVKLESKRELLEMWPKALKSRT